MGTNYYYHTNVCEHCKRTDILHVGKSSAGWTFHFRGYRTDFGADQNITSIDDWAKVFKTTPGILVDEYDRVVGDPMRFLAQLERPSPTVQTDEDSNRRTSAFDPSTEWRDSEGFAFYDGEFC